MTANIGQRIRWSEFGHQLSKIGALQDALQCPVRPKIAVGVSGGADSMALAYLLHHFVYDKDHERKAFDVYSFIVDHGARVESRDEALVVKQNLDNLGIRSEILSIRWPKSFDPKTDSAFEENARVARYDLIMRSAMHYGCKALFTGHHLDDNIETLLFRLARNKQHPLHSLCGIQDKSLVPCEHTFGVHGYSEIREARYSKSQKRQSSNSDISIRERPHRGSNLYRPLLGFPKSRILATCTSYTIPYVDDKTNHDPMFATRNAIRYMRQFDLPKALQAPRLLGLQKRARSFLSDIENSAKNLCRTMSRLRIYTNTGTMEVKAEVPLAAVDDQSWQYLMARILEVVAPQTGTDFPALMPALKMRAILNLDKNDKLEPVMLRKTLIYVKSAFNSDTVSLHLVLHRQPLSKGDLKKARLPFVLDTSSDIELSAQIFSSKYILWDDRFWIRVSCPSEDAISKISIRAYETEDISEVKSALKAQSRDREFDCEMRRIFPSRFSDFRPSNRAPISAFVRHTLPVLVYNDHIVAFPTLNFSVQPELVPQLSWQVKYRRADRVLDFFTAHFSQTDPGISPVLGEDVKKGTSSLKQVLPFRRV